MKVEKGTGGMSDVDISWIPQETLNVMSMFIFTEAKDSRRLRCDHLLVTHENEPTQRSDFYNPVFQTKPHLKHLQGNEPTGQLELINKMVHVHPSPCLKWISGIQFPS